MSITRAWLSGLVAVAWAAATVAVAMPASDRPALGPDQIELVRVAELAGLEVVDQEGAAIGSVGYVTLSLAQGRLSHLLVTTPRDDYLVVPWGAVRIDAGAPPLVLGATAQQIENAPRVTAEQLATLAQPAVAAHVRDYWAPASEVPSREGAGLEGPDPMVLAGSEMVVSIMAPMLEVDEALRGSTVYGDEGRAIGSIQEIVIDPEQGVVAFAVIDGERGRAAVPVQRLSWTAEDAVVLQADAGLLRRERELLQRDLVNRQTLAQLYERFEVPVPW